MDPESIEFRAREFVLASMLTGYPDAELEATFCELGAALSEHAALGAMWRWCEQGHSLDVLRARHIELFDSGKARVSLYETEYGRMRAAAKGHELADIAGFYQAFGFGLDVSVEHELLDHLAVELEFHALMLTKHAALMRASDAEGCEIVEDAMKKFLAHHLGSFVRAIADQSAVRDDPAYGPVLRWTAELVASECARLGVNVKPLDYFVDAEIDQEHRCATSLPVIR